MNAFVQTNFDSGIGTITLTRAEKKNALTRELIESLLAAVDRLTNEPELRLLILAAEGDVFCAGMDLAEMQARATSPNGKEDWHIDSQVYCDLLQRLYGMSVPTLVKLQGPVLAGGVGMVLACDLVVASSNAFFSLPEPARGITAAIVTPLLVHRMGCGPAGQLLLSGERMSADRAYQLGLCHDVVSPTELERRIETLTAAILAGSMSALSITKRHLSGCSAADIPGQLRDSIAISAQARQTSDAREGLASFLEKRKPAWQPAAQ